MKNLRYTNNPLDGLFNYARTISPNPFHVDTPNDYITAQNYFCSYYKGAPGSSIIDGDTNLAWSNVDKTNEAEAWFIIDLKLSSFMLEYLTFRSACHPPGVLSVSGSNDNKSYYPICRLNDLTEVGAPMVRKCNDIHKAFRFFKFVQIGTNRGGTYRLHVSELEFFGVLNPLYQTSIRSFFISRHVLLSFLYFIAMS